MAAEFNNGVLTEKGLALLAKWQAGKCTPEITRAACGSGSYANGDAPAAQTALKIEQITTGFSKKTVQNESTLLLKIVFSNEEVTEGFSMTEIGIFATDPDEGEILYSLAVSADEENADYISAYNGEYPSNITFNYQIQVSNAGSVTFTPWSGVYAAADDLEALDEKVAALQPEISYYGVCDTDESTAAKVVTVADSFALTEGASVRVKFTYGHSFDDGVPTMLNVNETGSFQVYIAKNAVPKYAWKAGEAVDFVYDGANWNIVHANEASTIYYGVTKLTDSVTSTSSTTAATPNAVKMAYDAAAAAKETADANSEDIAALKPEIAYYGTCSTDPTTAAKEVTVSDNFTLETGVSVRIKFEKPNTATNPTLNVNETGAAPIMLTDAKAVGAYRWDSGAVSEFTYDGTNWMAHLQTSASGTYWGVVRLSDSVTSANGASTAYAATPNAVKQAYDTAVALQDRDALLEYICDSGVSSRNGVFRGADLTDVYTVAELHTKVSGGDFSNLYIGDYITVSITTSYGGTESVDLVIAAFDYFYKGGDTSLTTHHIVMVPKDNFSTLAAMNSSATTEGGYSGSDMHTTVLPVYYTALNSALSSHILTHRRYLTTVVSTSAASAGGAGFTGSATTAAQADTNLCLMSEAMVYGGAVFSSSGRDIADACIQLPLFKLRPDYRIAMRGKGSTSRCDFWLCGVASSAYFCLCDYSGFAIYNTATNSRGVRPYFLFS